MNIYEKNGLRVAEIEYGWGMDMEAIEFPVKLAMEGLMLGARVASNGKEFMTGKINQPELLQMMSYCRDVIENAKNGESTFVLSGFFGEQIETMQRVAKMVDKLKSL